MSAFAQALNYGIPLFVLLILIEHLYGWYKGNITGNSMDTIASLSSGITNTTKAVLGLTVAILSYTWLESKIGIFDLPNAWWVYLLAFVGKDFAGYWIHRLEHRINFAWNRHIVHHSSEEFNLPCALRQSISEIFSFTAFFLVPLAILGVPGTVYAVIAPIHLFAQFWYHTRHIKRMGFLEHIIVTPAHHRVHHAINPQYLDKNFSQIFIVWDKLFGTFQEELDDVPPVYGVKRAVGTWNPFLINFQHMWLLFTDMWRTKSWKDKARLWFMPTGWRPADVAEKYPIKIIDDPYTQVKYAPKASGWLKAWAFIQLTVTLGLMLYLFNMLGNLQPVEIFTCGAFIFFNVFAYTTLMDRKAYAFWLELVLGAAAIGYIYATGDWFKISTILPYGQFVVGGYFAFSALSTAAFVKWDITKDALLAIDREAMTADNKGRLAV